MVGLTPLELESLGCRMIYMLFSRSNYVLLFWYSAGLWRTHDDSTYHASIASSGKNGSCNSDHPLFGVACYRRLGFDIVYLRAKFDDSSFNRCNDTIGGVKIKSGSRESRDPDHTTFKSDLSSLCWDLTFSWHSLNAGFIRSGDMLGARRNLNGSSCPAMALSGIVCHPWASICYDQHIYKTWNLYLYTLRWYDRRYKIAAMGRFGPWGS